jgi:hypothetical protein
MKSLLASSALLLTSASAITYSDAQAEISLNLSNVAYCGKASYLTYAFSGPASGFKATKVIYHAVDDT